MAEGVSSDIEYQTADSEEKENAYLSMAYLERAAGLFPSAYIMKLISLFFTKKY